MDDNGIRPAAGPSSAPMRLFTPNAQNELVELVDEDDISGHGDKRKKEEEQEESLEEFVQRRKKGKSKKNEDEAPVSAGTLLHDVVIPHVLVLPVASKRRKDKYDEPLDDFLQRRKKKKREAKSRDRAKYLQTIVTDFFRYTKVKQEKSQTTHTHEQEVGSEVSGNSVKDVLQSDQYKFDASAVPQDDDIQIVECFPAPPAAAEEKTQRIVTRRQYWKGEARITGQMRTTTSLQLIHEEQPLELCRRERNVTGSNTVVPVKEEDVKGEQSSVGGLASTRASPISPYDEHPLAFLTERPNTVDGPRPRRSLDPFLHRHIQIARPSIAQMSEVNPFKMTGLQTSLPSSSTPGVFWKSQQYGLQPIREHHEEKSNDEDMTQNSPLVSNIPQTQLEKKMDDEDDEDMSQNTQSEIITSIPETQLEDHGDDAMSQRSPHMEMDVTSQGKEVTQVELTSKNNILPESSSLKGNQEEEQLNAQLQIENASKSAEKEGVSEEKHDEREVSAESPPTEASSELSSTLIPTDEAKTPEKEDDSDDSPKLTATEEAQTPEKDKISEASPKFTPTEEPQSPENEQNKVSEASPKFTPTEEPQSPENDKDNVSQPSPKFTPTEEPQSPEKEQNKVSEASPKFTPTEEPQSPENEQRQRFTSVSQVYTN